MQFERHQSFTDAPLKICPECRKKSLRKVISPVRVVFKGSGFYSTDHRPSSASSDAASTEKRRRRRREKPREERRKAREASSTRTKDKATELSVLR